MGTPPQKSEARLFWGPHHSWFLSLERQYYLGKGGLKFDSLWSNVPNISQSWVCKWRWCAPNHLAAQVCIYTCLSDGESWMHQQLPYDWSSPVLSYNNQSPLLYTEDHRRWFVHGWLLQNRRVQTVSRACKRGGCREERAFKNLVIDRGLMKSRLISFCSGHSESLTACDCSIGSVSVSAREAAIL